MPGHCKCASNLISQHAAAIARLATSVVRIAISFTSNCVVDSVTICNTALTVLLLNEERSFTLSILYLKSKSYQT